MFASSSGFPLLRVYRSPRGGGVSVGKVIHEEDLRHRMLTLVRASHRACSEAGFWMCCRNVAEDKDCSFAASQLMVAHF